MGTSDNLKVIKERGCPIVLIERVLKLMNEGHSYEEALSIAEAEEKEEKCAPDVVISRTAEQEELESEDDYDR